MSDQHTYVLYKLKSLPHEVIPALTGLAMNGECDAIRDQFGHVIGQVYRSLGPNHERVAMNPLRI